MLETRIQVFKGLLLLLVNCEINVLGFSFHCLANEVDSGDRVLHLHMKVFVLL